MSRPVVLSVDTVEGGLRVVFERRQGRYAHRIEWRSAAGEWTPLLESVEGGLDDIWPTSPAIQEVHVEDRDGSRVALGVGMAGKSHWSLAVKLAADGRELTFEAACRVREAPQALGSAYRDVAESCDVDWLIYALPTAQSLEKDRLRIFLPTEVAPRAPQTVAWAYAISVNSTTQTNEPLGTSGTSGSPCD